MASAQDQTCVPVPVVILLPAVELQLLQVRKLKMKPAVKNQGKVTELVNSKNIQIWVNALCALPCFSCNTSLVRNPHTV